MILNISIHRVLMWMINKENEVATDLTHIKVGDKLALKELGSRTNCFAVDHRILVVSRLTATQACCVDVRGFGGEWRFRLSDGKEIGEGYSHAEIATPQILAKNEAQLDAANRLRSAESDLSDLFDKCAHQLKLSLEQTEALAKAWLEVKAMSPQVGPSWS